MTHLRAPHGALLLSLVLAPLAGLPESTSAQEPEDSVVVQIPPLTVEVLRWPLAGARTPFAVAGLEIDESPLPTNGAFLADVLRALPGLEIQNRHNFAVGERLSVRGFGARAQFGVRGLRAILDGIPATLPDGQTTLDHVDPAALARVELLRGPGSAWYGNGAGGVLLLETRAPEPGRRIDARVLVGELGRRELTARASDGGSRAGDPGTTLGVTRIDWDGFRSNPVDGGTYGGAERTVLTATHRRTLGDGELRISAVGLDLDAENPGSLPLDSIDDPDRSAWGFNVRQRTGKTVRQGQVGASWRGAFTGSLGAEVAVWGVARELRNPIPGTVVEVDRTGGGARLGVDGRMGSAAWAAGVEVELQSDDRRNFDNDDGRNGPLELDQTERVRGVALFARTGTSLGPADLQAAIRWDAVRFKADDRFVSPSNPDDSGARTLDALSPSLGVRLPVGSFDIFASVGSFLETPTTTELVNRPDGGGGFNPDLEPTRGWTGELGVRGSAGNRIGWELVAFNTELRDELVPFEVPSDPGRSYFRNVGESRHRGIEAAVRAVLSDELSLRSAYTRVDARFQDGLGPDVDGNRIPGRSPARLETRADWSRSAFAASLDLTWSDAVPVDDEGTTEAPSWFRVDARLGLTPVALSSASFAPWVEVGNITDADYIGSVTVNAFGGRYFEPAPGRTLSVGVSIGLEPGRSLNDSRQGPRRSGAR
ncbi:MAG: TonB-dependent receptor [Gemmatimonadetes bacterium]|nr:TonB-dependent receptor [Gemmatimonadota bacterium]